MTDFTTLDAQVKALLPHLHHRERILFLAGVRFATGHAQFGDNLFRITDQQLEHERLEEQADELVYGLELSRRQATND